MFRIKNFFKAKLWVQVTVVGVPLLIVAYLIWHFVVAPSCGPGVARIDGQCIGVTDGEVALSEDLKDVLGKIRQENERIKGENLPKVSVAYLIPLPEDSAGDGPQVDLRLRRELEGAHIAQLQANRTRQLGDKPLIRLLVANSGDRSSHWQRVVPDLLDMMKGPDQLVTVVATGNTIIETLEAIEDLRSGGLPVIMSRLAGDSFTAPDPNLKGALARLAPSGGDQAAAAAAYLKGTTSRALIVRDVNPDDTFVRGLEESFRKAFPDDTHTVLEQPETYNSQLPGIATSMKGILRNICFQKPDIVYFAGRVDALDAFIQQLPVRDCTEFRINVMTSGGSTAELPAKIKQGIHELAEGLEANATVQYTAQAHPGAWKAKPESFFLASTSRLISSCEYCFTTVFPGETLENLENLEDGGAIIGYDAILTVITAIRPGEGTVINDTPDLISQQFKRLHGIDAVGGATGWISLDPHGNPINKAVVILQVNPDGTLTFLELSSPLGSPCVRGTPPC